MSYTKGKSYTIPADKAIIQPSIYTKQKYCNFRVLFFAEARKVVCDACAHCMAGVPPSAENKGMLADQTLAL